MAAVKAKKTGVPVQSSLKGFVKRPAAADRQVAWPAKDESNVAVADPDLARALAASLAESSQPGRKGSKGDASARDVGVDEGRRAAEESKGRTMTGFAQCSRQ